MTLPAQARSELTDALEGALNRSELRRVARLAFNKELEILVEEGDLAGQIDDLVAVAERMRLVRALVVAAGKIQPTNTDPRDWLDRWGSIVPGSDATQSGSAPSALASSQASFSPATMALPNPEGGSTGFAADRTTAKSGPALSQRPTQDAPGRAQGPDRTPWELVLDDVWTQVWEVVRGLLGDSTRDNVRVRLANEMRQRLNPGPPGGGPARAISQTPSSEAKAAGDRPSGGFDSGRVNS